jgi:rubredoxin
MAKKSFAKINMRGGIISSGDLGHLVQVLKTNGIEEIELGERQNIYFFFEKIKKQEIEELLQKAGLDFEIDAQEYPNIISSYAAEDTFSTHSWKGEGVYRDIMYSFSHKPKIKINISDNTQALVPLYTGCLNFIPSSHVNFYFLYINHPSVGGLQCWNKLIYSTEISGLSKVLEQELLSGEYIFDIKALAQKVESAHRFITMEIDAPLQTHRLRFPYYEGMNKYGDKFWLGIYRRDNHFSKDLLESIADLCAQTRIGEINITPWKSIMIKGIVEEERIEWEKLLSRHGINSRHSSLELNWRTADMNPEALRIKTELVKDFDEQDIRTYGLTFSIYTGKPFEMCSSIVIKKRPSLFNFWGFLKKFTTYDILFAQDFNLNATTHMVYSYDVTWNSLALNLRNLTHNYYKQLSQKAPQIKPPVKQEKSSALENLFQCRHCMTMYDEKYGEPENNIPAGTSFESLPDTYQCPICENPKADFVKKDAFFVVS